MTEHFVQSQSRVMQYPPLGILFSSFSFYLLYFPDLLLQLSFATAKSIKITDVALDPSKSIENWDNPKDEEAALTKGRKRKAPASKKGKEKDPPKEGPTKKAPFFRATFQRKLLRQR